MPWPTSSPLLRTKSVATICNEAEASEHKLARRLTGFDLMVLGVGAIIGAGIFVLTGTAAATKAGPAVILSFLLSGLGCALAAFCYAELASTIPVAGSAYTYAYATLGEFVAWLIGWDLILEYIVAASTVAIGWSGYFTKWLEGFGVIMPHVWTHGAFDGGIINLPAVGIIVLITVLLIVGVKESAWLTGLLVVLKLSVIFVFLLLGTPWVRPENWSPFMPFGAWGIVAGAGVIFFAYIGFDAITTTSEETRNPSRDVPFGILGSLAVCTLLYIAVSLVLTGMVPYAKLNHPAPVALALELVGIPWGMQLVSLGAVVGLASVLIVMLIAQPRIFFVMSRDGLISPWIAKVHPKLQTPYRATLATGAAVMVGAAVLPISASGEMTSIGTLFAFMVVCVGVIILRKTQPNLRRGFRTPFSPYVPALGALVCLIMMCGLEWATWFRFIGWMIIGVIIYFSFGRRHSRLNQPEPTPSL